MTDSYDPVRMLPMLGHLMGAQMHILWGGAGNEKGHVTKRFCSAIKKDRVLPPAGKWMESEIITLAETVSLR